MENRLGLILTLAGAAVIGSFCAGQNWPPGGGEKGPDTTKFAGPQCPLCCMPTDGWRRVVTSGLPDRYVNDDLPCPMYKVLDSASTDPGNPTYMMRMDSASTDPGNRQIDSIVIYGR